MGRRIRQRREKDRVRFLAEKVNKCGQCKSLHGGTCDEHKIKAYKGDVACYKFEAKDK